jgi:glycosyltransferase involved in cell wall biosynthesis
MTNTPNEPVSVIITNYNQGRFAKRALDSILSQQHPLDLLEVVIVDDGSTDDSVAIIEELLPRYQEFFDVKLITQTNKRTAGARNTGIRNTSHEFISLLDIDDEYCPTKIKRCVEELLRYQHVALVYSDYIEVKENRKWKTFKEPFDNNVIMTHCIVSTNPTFRRSCFNQIGEYDEQLYYSEDYDMYLRLCQLFMFRHIPETLFLYHHHGENKMQQVVDADDKAQEWGREEHGFKTRASKGVYFVSNEQDC